VAGVESLKSSHPIQSSPRTQLVADPTPAPPVADRSTRRLPAWTQMFTEKFGKKRILVFLLYYPILSGAILAGAALFLAVFGMLRSRANEKGEALVLFIGLASAFTLFPQYFFFRPDP